MLNLHMMGDITWRDRASMLAQVSLSLLEKPLMPPWGPYPHEPPESPPKGSSSEYIKVKFPVHTPGRHPQTSGDVFLAVLSQQAAAGDAFI